MKRPMPWNDKEDDPSSDESSSDSESDAEDGPEKSRRPSEAKIAKRKGGGIDFEALMRHGYKGGLSVLKVPPPKVAENRDWSWSTGKEKSSGDQETEESYRERQKTRAALADGEQLATAITQKEKDKKSFAQKEKRKRDLGQTSRGKNYVEEEKRMLRDNGVYSGFDS